jgi:hypothetical protein
VFAVVLGEELLVHRADLVELAVERGLLLVARAKLVGEPRVLGLQLDQELAQPGVLLEDPAHVGLRLAADLVDVAAVVLLRAHEASATPSTLRSLESSSVVLIGLVT